MWQVKFYSDKNGASPVKDFINKLAKKSITKVNSIITLLQEKGINLPSPYAKKLTGVADIWELRIKHSSNSYRIFYFFLGVNSIYLLHGFTKKTNNTPQNEIDKAKRRMDEIRKKGC